MMTSHLCAASVLRTKPGACGYHAVAQVSCRACRPEARRPCSRSPRPSRSRTACCAGRHRRSAPWGRSSSSDECGRSTPARAMVPEQGWRPTRSRTHKRERRRHAPTENVASNVDRFSIDTRGTPCTGAAADAHASAQPVLAEAAVFGLGSTALGLVFVLLRSSARNGVIGARPQIDEYVVDVAHDIRIGAERRHDALLRRVDVLAPVDDNVGEVRIVCASSSNC